MIKKKLLAIFIIAILTIISSTCTTFAINSSASLSASNQNPTVGDTVTVTATVVAGAFNVTLSGNGQTEKIVGQTDTTDNISKSASITFTPTEAKTYTFTLTGDYSDFITDEELSVNKSITITVKAKQNNNNSGGNSGSNSGGGSTTPKPQEPQPSFSSVNQTVYATTDVNVRSSWSTSSSIVGSLSEGESVTRIGIGDNGWSKISFNGSTAYAYSDYLTTAKPQSKQEEPKQNENKQDENKKTDEKSANKFLSTLEIKNSEIKNKLTPEFNKDVTQYTLKIPNSVEKLDINAKAEDEKAKVEISGNDKLINGSNIIKIKVTAEDGTVRTYIINAEKETKENELRLTELTISDVTLNENFNSNKFEYTAKLLKKDITKLNINAKANDIKALIEIIGNENIQEGENLITILVKSQDGKEITTYQIKVEKEVEEEQLSFVDQFKDLIYVGIGFIVLLIIFIPIYISIKKKKDVDFSEYPGMEEIKLEDENENEIKNDIENANEENNEEETVTTENDDIREDYLNNFNSKEEKNNTRRKKGKHF